jgi:hypothetical protein
LRAIATGLIFAGSSGAASVVEAKSRSLLLRSSPAAALVPQPNGPLLIVTSIKRQRVRVFDANGEIASSRISSGKPGYNTPTGVFAILEKNVYHRSNIYSGASMPYQERITWSGIAFHAGDIPGYPASHGCIRLPYSFARKLFGLTKIGGRAVVSYDDPEPIAFQSPKLWRPLPLETPATAQSDAGRPQLIAVNDRGEDVSATDAVQGAPRLIGVSPALLRAVADMPKDPQRRPTTRTEADQLVQERLDRARSSVKSAEAALLSADEKAKATGGEYGDAGQKFNAARAVVEPLRSALQSAEARQKDAVRAFEAFMSAQTSEGATPSDAGKDRESELEDALLDFTIEADKARADVAQNEMTFAEVQARFSAVSAARDAAADALRDAQADLESAKTSLTEANKDMRLRSKPIAVFVSLRAQRIYVRQGFEPLMEVPIAIAPLRHKVGTHVFTAMRYGSDPNTFDWRLVSAQTPKAGQAFEDNKKKRRTALAQGPALDVQMATEALEAFNIPDDIMQLLTERARPGSSLIVSDRELPAHENGGGTEFVVLTR